MGPIETQPSAAMRTSQSTACGSCAVLHRISHRAQKAAAIVRAAARRLARWRASRARMVTDSTQHVTHAKIGSRSKRFMRIACVTHRRGERSP
jgi:hypothetical protein